MDDKLLLPARFDSAAAQTVTRRTIHGTSGAAP